MEEIKSVWLANTFLWRRLPKQKQGTVDVLVAETKNPGILAVIREVSVMGLGKNLRLLYEAHMKEIRDRNAREAYVYDEGHAAGKAEGHATGKAEKMLNETVRR